MRQLRILDLPAAADKLGTSFIIAVIVLALFWAYQLHQVFNERDYLIRTIAFEASGETEIGKVAVAYVVLNRQKRGRWGDTIKAVVTSPGQFEWERLIQRQAQHISSIRSSSGCDAAVHCRHGPVGRDNPIGRHVFYSPDVSPQHAPLISSAMVDLPFGLAR